MRGHVRERGGEPDAFSNGLATVWSYVTEGRRPRLGDGVRRLGLIAERVAPRIRAGDPPG